MADPINDKPFTPISFTLPVGGRPQYETASAACLYVAEGSGITPGGLSLQLDENEPFRVAVGVFIRVRRFDKIRLINNLGVAINGVIYISADPDFLYMVFPQGI
jgi:hypothetical protein